MPESDAVPASRPITTRPARAARVVAVARLETARSRVEIGGQVLDATGTPIVGAELIVRAPWGVECTTLSSAVGSFGVRFSAPDDALGRRVTIESGDVTQQVGIA